MAYGNPRFSELGKVLTKVALERSGMVLCSPDRGAHGGNEYWRTLLDKLTLISVQSHVSEGSGGCRCLLRQGKNLATALTRRPL